MADRYWLGVNSNWNDTSNWSTTRQGSGGSAAPVTNDVVYILDGNTDITTNISQAAVDLSGLTIGGEFTGSIGSVGSSLTIAVSGTGTPICRINYSGPGAINIAAGTNNIDDMRITRPGGGGGRVNLVGGTTTALYTGRGVTLYIDDAAVVTTLTSTGSVITAGYSATAFTTATVGGGSSLTSRRAATTLNIDAATVRFGNVAAITTINARNGANYVHDSSGTITTANGLPGSRLLANATAFTVTNANVYEGSSVFTNNPALVTFTNDPVYLP